MGLQHLHSLYPTPSVLIDKSHPEQVIYTWIIIAYIELSSRLFPAVYNMWAAAVLEIVAVIFWLSSFASLAGYITTFFLITCGSADIYGNLFDCTLAPRNSSVAAASLGGLLL